MPINHSVDTAMRMADMRLGMRVDRPAQIVLAATVPIFTVSNGNILLTGFYGEIMTTIETAVTLTLNYDVTEAAALDIILGSATGNMITYVPGRMITLPAAAGVFAVSATCGAAPIDVVPNYVLPPGHFDLVSGVATVTGTIRWSMWYLQLDPEARVVAN
jgi:hypothetical protein